MAYQLGNFEASDKSSLKLAKKMPVLVREIVAQESVDPVAIVTPKPESKLVILRSMDCQTEQQQLEDNPQLETAKILLNNLHSQLSAKDNAIMEKQRSDNKIPNSNKTFESQKCIIAHLNLHKNAYFEAIVYQLDKN